MLLREAAKTYNWKLNYGSIALMWRGGCIIRSRFLGNIKTAFDKKPELTCLLLDDFFKAAILDCQVILNAACTILYTYTVCVCVCACVSAVHTCVRVCVCVCACVRVCSYTLLCVFLHVHISNLLVCVPYLRTLTFSVCTCVYTHSCTVCCINMHI